MIRFLPVALLVLSACAPAHRELNNSSTATDTGNAPVAVAGLKDACEVHHWKTQSNSWVNCTISYDGKILATAKPGDDVRCVTGGQARVIYPDLSNGRLSIGVVESSLEPSGEKFEGKDTYINIRHLGEASIDVTRLKDSELRYEDLQYAPGDQSVEDEKNLIIVCK